MTRHRPLIRRWPQYKADHGKGQPITQPAGTHRTLDGQLVAWVDNTALHDTTKFPALIRAALDTPQQTLILVGPHRETTRVYQALHGWCDTHLPKQLPETHTRPRPVGTYERCGEPRPRTGRPCGAAAGWGTDHIGSGPCAHHGGSVEMKEAARELVNEELDVLQRLARKATTGEAITVEDRLNGAIALRVALVEIQRRKRTGRKL